VLERTSDGGASWRPVAALPGGRSLPGTKDAPKGLWLLQCDPDGNCIGLLPTGTNTDGGLAAMRSTDEGRTWAVSATHLPPTEIVLLSCGDARHCMAVTADGITMTYTSDGGVTWREAAGLSAELPQPGGVHRGGRDAQTGIGSGSARRQLKPPRNGLSCRQAAAQAGHLRHAGSPGGNRPDCLVDSHPDRPSADVRMGSARVRQTRGSAPQAGPPNTLGLLCAPHSLTPQRGSSSSCSR
jgi:hypothetical protein